MSEPTRSESAVLPAADVDEVRVATASVSGKGSLQRIRKRSVSDGSLPYCIEQPPMAVLQIEWRILQVLRDQQRWLSECHREADFPHDVGSRASRGHAIQIDAFRAKFSARRRSVLRRVVQMPLIVAGSTPGADCECAGLDVAPRSVATRIAVIRCLRSKRHAHD